MLPRFFIDRPVFAWVIALVILLTGLLSLNKLPVAQYPDVAPPAIAITATYPGASAQVVEESVTSLIEQEMNGLENLLYMESASDSMGTMTLTITFASGTNLDFASVDAQNRIKRVEARLPEEVRRQGITVVKSRRNYLMFITLFSPDRTQDAVALGSFTASTILEQLRRVPGVGEANLFGTEYAMRIWLDPAQLTALNLTPGDALRAVRAQNNQLVTGELGQLPALPGQQLNAPILVRSRLNSSEEFGNILLRTNSDGSTVRLKDVAKVEWGAQEYTIRARLNGQPTAAVGIKVAPGANALDTAERVKQRMKQLQTYFPAGISWDIPYDTSTFIRISIQEVIVTLGEAMVLVFLVMFLFLGNLRATFIPAIVVPIALTGALVGIYLLGYSINVLTLFAMVLSIGIVVDDAIVVVENVERVMMEEQLPARQATRKAMTQIFSAIIGITLVLSSVFVPMAFFSGSVGAIYRQFAVTLVLTMLFSALMALTLTPALCATLLHNPQGHAHNSPGLLRRFAQSFLQTSESYRLSIAGILRRPLLYLTIYLAIAITAGGLFLRLPGGFLPDEDQGYFISIIQLPPGATQERTLEILSQVENYYLQQFEVAKVVGVAGFSFFGKGQNSAITFVRLKSWDTRKQAEEQASALVLRANIALSQIKQALIFAINVPPIPELSAVGGFDLRLQDRSGSGRDALLEARNQLLGLASQNPNLAGVRPEGLEAGPQLLMTIDRTKASAMGIDLAELNETMQVALGSAYINDLIREGRILQVQMQANADTRSDLQHLLTVRVRNRSGQLIPLSELVQSRWVAASPKLDRYNGLPSMKLAGNPAPGHSTGEAMTTMENLAQQLPPGIGFEWSSTSFEESLSGAQVPMLFGLSLLVVFLCLAALYESWSIPFAVLLIVPIGLFGAVLTVLALGMPNDVYFKVGLVAVIGLSAKNAILIVEFARTLAQQGMPLLEATLEACRMRFRPIVMTSAAFILGVMPLVFSTGAGAASRRAIGTGVMGGMLSATLLGLFLIPVLFVTIRRIFPEQNIAADPPSPPITPVANGISHE
ncbi:efflux RND transporter permease subunit [Candidatus Magnetaquicoccus inordinatus]|uniref:efflux RND transporter permease subunit n=1 Tax=Candidatus Magnetaquicoccus inordinatus TaxID=2496818 RepID=UPI002A4E2BA4|nr:efflux RND transporter permease subunit [Candidatus Magnetaquicoccus inordinatus]